MAGQAPIFFGPNAWAIAHLLTLRFEELDPTTQAQVQASINTFIHGFTNLLECGACRQDGGVFAKRLATAQLSPFTYFHALHNLVNQKLHKQDQPDLNTARKRWRDFRNQKNSMDVLNEYMIRLLAHFDNRTAEAIPFYEDLLRHLPTLVCVLLGEAGTSLCKTLQQISTPITRLQKPYTSAKLLKAYDNFCHSLCKILENVRCPTMELVQHISMEYAALNKIHDHKRCENLAVEMKI